MISIRDRRHPKDNKREAGGEEKGGEGERKGKGEGNTTFVGGGLWHESINQRNQGFSCCVALETDEIA